MGVIPETGSRSTNLFDGRCASIAYFGGGAQNGLLATHREIFYEV